MEQSVYIAGVGVISGIGNNVAEHLAAFERGEPGMADITLFKSIHQYDRPVAEVKLTDDE